MMRRIIFISLTVAIVFSLTAISIATVIADREENGYIAFNTGEFAEAKHYLDTIAALGNSSAQGLMGYICGLGLGQPVDFAEALYWMKRQNKLAVGEQAYYLGKIALEGRYGESKKELGIIWLGIAKHSGAEKANAVLQQLAHSRLPPLDEFDGAGARSSAHFSEHDR